MNFAHHVPAEQNFASHTLATIVIVLAITVVIAGVFMAYTYRKAAATREEDKK